jgi:zinc-finger of transposase IS204/IS1001/IS1096/IS1165
MGKKLSYKESLSNLNGSRVRKLVPAGPGWVVEAEGSSHALCPDCGVTSHSRHGRYWRKLRDLPLQGASVTLKLQMGVGVAEVGDVGDNFCVSIPGKLSLPKTPSELKMQRFRAFMRSCCHHDVLSFRRFFVAGRLQLSNPRLKDEFARLKEIAGGGDSRTRQNSVRGPEPRSSSVPAVQPASCRHAAWPRQRRHQQPA